MSCQSSSSKNLSMRRMIVIMLVVLVALSAIQVESVEGRRQDLMFVKGKFIKRDRQGVIVVDDKCHCCHGGKR